MTFDEILAQVVEILQRQGRVSYGALKRRFELDDDYLQDIKDELISAQRLATDERGKILVWTGKEELRETEKREQQVVSSQLSVLSSSQTPNPELQTPDSEDSRVSSPQPTDTPRSTLDVLGAEGERRPLTVMCCGFLDPGRNQAGLEAEELGRLVQQQQITCAAVVERYEGYVAQYLSDGLLVYFGYPVAHEDDAQRAVRAGREIVTTMAALNQERDSGMSSLSVRIGIHTGTVIVGALGDMNRRELVALGETPKVATRLQEAADPSTVVLSATTYRLVKNVFSCQSLGRHEVRGLPVASEIYRVEAERDHRSRGEATPGMLLPFVGREEVLQLLLKRWEQVQEGHGQVVLLSGEGGF
jgi:class 3 adenylate cyclase